MKIIFIGDIVGRSGRKAVSTNLDQIKEKFKPDIIFIDYSMNSVKSGSVV